MNNKSQLPATGPSVVTTLTLEQADQVAGGTLVLAAMRGGCPTCTSGRLTAFANLAALVNPAPMF